MRLNNFFLLKTFTFLFFDIFCFGQKKISLKCENLKSRHDRVFLVLFSDSLSKNT